MTIPETTTKPPEPTAPAKAPVTLTAGETTYTLELSTNVLAAAERLASQGGAHVPFFELASRIDDGSMTATALLVWAGLQAHHATVVKTPLDAGRIVDAAGWVATTHALKAAMEAMDHSAAAAAEGAPMVADTSPPGPLSRAQRRALERRARKAAKKARRG